MTIHISKTELLYKKSKPIDHLSVGKGIALMVKEQKDAAIAVKNVTDSLELAINQIYERLMLHNKGRLIYAGAGTSGEAPPARRRDPYGDPAVLQGRQLLSQMLTWRPLEARLGI